MRVVVAFTAALSTAAIIVALQFLIAGLFAGVTLPPSIFVVYFGLNFLAGVPATLAGAFPVWIVFRYRQVHSPRAFALAGAALALINYLLLVALGMGEPSDHPMTFLENLGRAFHIPRIAGAMVAGAGGSLVFWLIAVRRSFRRVLATSSVS